MEGLFKVADPNWFITTSTQTIICDEIVETAAYQGVRDRNNIIDDPDPTIWEELERLKMDPVQDNLDVDVCGLKCGLCGCYITSGSMS
jgi:hypothetical protein